MNKYIFTILIVLFIGQIGLSQSKEKIKGNRNVTVKQTYVDDFSTLIVKNNFEVNLAFNSKTSVEVEADDNLHDVIDIEVIDGVLTIETARRITSKKKLIITVNYSSQLRTLELFTDAELRSLTSLELDDVSLKTNDNSRAYLNVKSHSFQFTASGKSKSRLNITSDSTNFVLNDNSKLDALVNGTSSAFDIYQRADATIEGTSETSTLRIDNSSNFSGKNYTIKTANVLVENSADAIIHVTEALTLDASGSTETYLYGNPKINLNSFTDTAKLQKKDINEKGLF